MLKKYRCKTLFQGYKIGLPDSDKYIAVPKHIRGVNTLLVTYGKSHMVVDKLGKALKEVTFDDKFGRGTYTLQYFKWMPSISKRDQLRDHPSVKVTPSIKNAVMTTPEKEKALEWLKEARERLGGGTHG